MKAKTMILKYPLTGPETQRDYQNFIDQDEEFLKREHDLYQTNIGNTLNCVTVTYKHISKFPKSAQEVFMKVKKNERTN